MDQQVVDGVKWSQAKYSGDEYHAIPPAGDPSEKQTPFQDTPPPPPPSTAAVPKVRLSLTYCPTSSSSNSPSSNGAGEWAAC